MRPIVGSRTRVAPAAIKSTLSGNLVPPDVVMALTNASAQEGMYRCFTLQR